MRFPNISETAAGALCLTISEWRKVRQYEVVALVKLDIIEVAGN